MAVMVGMANFASSAVFAVLVVHAVGSESALGLTEPQFGLLFATLAIGSLLGGITAERLQGWLGRSRALLGSVLVSASYIVALALTTNVVPIAVAAFLSGVATMVWNVTTVSFRQRVTPDRLLGRLNSAYRLVAWGTRPLGAAAGGAVAQAFGTRAVFLVMGALAVSVVVPGRTITESALHDAEGEMPEV
jgi:MFS family permease